MTEKIHLVGDDLCKKRYKSFLIRRRNPLLKERVICRINQAKPSQEINTRQCSLSGLSGASCQQDVHKKDRFSVMELV